MTKKRIKALKSHHYINLKSWNDFEINGPTHSRRPTNRTEVVFGTASNYKRNELNTRLLFRSLSEHFKCVTQMSYIGYGKLKATCH